ncbi:hypothetical protein BZA70DRAFT_289325 [Myxozyma melibiosi]|uniref:Uncharacterized protein n=1 Tax=Myxozyma melibiosi TaxID=54550 RepID=A0ABR1F6D3_9ASCO
MTTPSTTSSSDVPSSPSASSENDTITNNRDDDSTGGGFLLHSPESPQAQIPRSSTSAVLSSVFSPDYELLDGEFNPSAHVSTPALHSAPAGTHRLSSAQQSKLINYLDEQLLLVSRRFVRKSAPSDDEDEDEEMQTVDHPADHNVYSTIEPLIDDLDKLIDLVWYSVPSTPVPFIQTQYLLRIADDFNDYIPHLPVTEPDKVFILLKKLDLIFFELIEGHIPAHESMSQSA